MRTGLHQWLLNNNAGCILFDVLFYSAPFLLVASLHSKKLNFIAAAWMLTINWVYVQCYTLYPTTSIEGYVAWLLFPILFLFSNEKTFSLLLEGLRYFFLFIMGSAGVWKFLQGGIFHPDQMSGILLYQHKELLTNSTGYWQTDLIWYLTEHKAISYLLYAAACLLELSFLAGFFTRKYDRYLAIAFLIFLVMDYVIMRIAYFEWLPFLILLNFSSKSNYQPKVSNNLLFL
jgi:glycosyltransferase involved in cell wall biosynthesis